MPQYRFKATCPRCGKITEVVADKPAPAPRANCGDCLMDHIEIVTMYLELIPDEAAVKAYIAMVGKRDADEGIE